MDAPRRVPYSQYQEYPESVMLERSRELCRDLTRRRTVRDFSDRPLPLEVVQDCLRAAGSAPSGANQQPWHFVVVQDPDVKKRIREAAEVEERAFYHERAPQPWLDALRPLGTDEHKSFLEVAPCLIAIFARNFGLAPDGSHIKHYYVTESVGIATGFLIAALHHAGLATLTHTPSPMRFLNALLDRPANERPFLLLVVGFPAEGATVPDISRKQFDEFVTFR